MNLLAFVVACVVALVISPVALVLLERLGLMDHPDQGRKFHSQAVPVGGGIVLFLAFFLTVLALSPALDEPLFNSHSQKWGFFGAATWLLLVGLYDDAKGLSAWHKLAAQCGAAAALYGAGFHIGLLTNPLGGSVTLGIWDFPLTVLWVVVLCNAMNLIDGLDGLACGVALIAAVTLGCIGLFPGGSDRDVPFLCFALGGAAFGFLRYNYHPARVFLGDTGSMFLGFVLAAIALTSARKSSTAIALLVPLVSLGVPVLDTSLAIVRRALSSKGIFSADADHLHHRLLRLGLAHEDVVKVFYFVSVWLGLVSLTFVLIPNRYGMVVFGVLALGLAFAIRALAFLEAVVHDLPPPRSLPLAHPLRWLSRVLLGTPLRLVETSMRNVLFREGKGLGPGNPEAAPEVEAAPSSGDELFSKNIPLIRSNKESSE